MIESLHIRGLALVEQAELELGKGLNVLTGETGAGKSLIRSALALLAGSRASSEALREGVEEAVVEAVLRTERMPGVTEELARRGFQTAESQLVVRRTLGRDGRSRARGR